MTLQGLFIAVTGRIKGLLNRGSDSLSGRLIRLAGIWLVISLIIVSIFLTQFFSYASMQRFQSGIDTLVTNLYSDTELSKSGQITAPDYDPRLSNPYQGLYWQIYELNDKGETLHIYKSASLLNFDLPKPAHLDQTGDKFHYNGVGPLGERLRLVSQLLIIKQRHLLFLAAEDSARVGRDVTSFALITGSALLFMTIFSLLAIYLQVRLGLKPLHDLSDDIIDIQKGKRLRLGGIYPKEIIPVASQINALLDDNQAVLERQRTHVGNLAHALKTPLAVLMTSATDEGELSHMVKKQTALMREQVDRHLRRARAAARSQTLGERSLMEPIIDELAVMLEQVFHQKGVEIDWLCPEALYFRGEKQDLQEMVGNLLENACIWSKGKVRLRVTGLADEPYGHITIEDNGPGLSEERYADVLKRGLRLDESAPGSGLGLSIVDELVKAYDGQLSFRPSQLGGLCVDISLPITW